MQAILPETGQFSPIRDFLFFFKGFLRKNFPGEWKNKQKSPITGELANFLPEFYPSRTTTNTSFLVDLMTLVWNQSSHILQLLPFTQGWTSFFSSSRNFTSPENTSFSQLWSLPEISIHVIIINKHNRSRNLIYIDHCCAYRFFLLTLIYI